MRYPLLAVCLAAGLATAAMAQPLKGAVPLDEAKAWDSQMKAFEQAGDRRLLTSLRPHTTMTLDIPAERGQRLQLSLEGERLRAFLEQSLAQNRQLAGRVRFSQECNWYSDPKTGDAVETCTLGVHAAKRVGGAPPTMYTYGIVSKDDHGLYLRSSWASDKKLF